ncbi:hypothetical protein ABZ990_22410 [Streptomyces sp. NPDC046203]|uniref:hypothetical protein n=1 Tax=Streptomyces sp. NPDC046203 TaxID=3154602 RepID=UPI0033C6DC4E
MPDHKDHDVTKTRFEEELSEALRRAGEGFEADDRRGLAAGGLVRGRRQLLRRRAATMGGVLALAAVSVGGVYGGSLLGAGHERVSAAGTGGSARGGGSVDGATSVAGEPAGTPVTGADVAAVLQANTPAGKWTFDDLHGSDATFATGVYDDGKGKAGVSVGLRRVETAGRGEAGRDLVTCPDRVVTPYDDCTEKALPGGSRLMIFQGYEYPDKRVLTKNWRAVLLTKDGFVIDASEYNAPTEKDSAISRENPPFDPTQLRALVTADGWHPLLEKLKQPGKNDGKPTADPSAPVHEELDTTRVTAMLRSLLPHGHGLKVVGQGSGYLIVDDGAGRSFVQVNVQEDMGSVRDDLFSGDGVTTEPDGTLVKVTKQAGEKGVEGSVWWMADTMTKDGFRVVVSAFNAGSQLEAPTRPEPALTTAQLKGIATNLKWRTLAQG